jgi:hypothetical protein
MHAPVVDAHSPVQDSDRESQSAHVAADVQWVRRQAVAGAFDAQAMPVPGLHGVPRMSRRDMRRLMPCLHPSIAIT